jgi:hypothetical protein
MQMMVSPSISHVKLAQRLLAGLSRSRENLILPFKEDAEYATVD